MKKEFNEAYENLFLEYPLQISDDFYIRRKYYRGISDLTRILRIVRNKINDFERGLSGDQILRADAKHFLLVNVHHMILSPLMVADYEDEPIFIEDEFKNILEDVDTILNETLTNSDSNKVITGHSLLNTINELWPKLNTTCRLP